MRFGIDIGGTKAVIAVVAEDGRMIRKEAFPTGAHCVCKDAVRLAAQKVRAMAGSQTIENIGICVPGTVDACGRIVVCAPNIGWYRENVAEYFNAQIGVLPYVTQDTRAAAWGESRTDAMKGKRCIACVTLGTGIGCGIVINGGIWNGALGTAGEIGHIPVVRGGRVCNCGKFGCMEAYASGLGMARTAKERNLCDTTEELFASAQAGNAEALDIIRNAAQYAATAVTALANILSPDAILFSGGLSKQRELFVEPIIRYIRAWKYGTGEDENLFIGMAAFGADAPAIGAAFLDKAYAV